MGIFVDQMVDSKIISGVTSLFLVFYATYHLGSTSGPARLRIFAAEHSDNQVCGLWWFWLEGMTVYPKRWLRYS